MDRHLEEKYNNVNEITLEKKFQRGSICNQLPDLWQQDTEHRKRPIGGKIIDGHEGVFILLTQFNTWIIVYQSPSIISFDPQEKNLKRQAG